MKRICALAYKEMLHIVRDPRSLALAVLMPLMMVLLYGYAIDMELKRLKVGVLDLDRSAQSADFVRRMTAGGFILDAGRVDSRAEIEPGFRRSRFHAVLVFPEGYARRLASQPASEIQILIDGADGTTAGVVNQYLSAVVARLSRDLMKDDFADAAQPLVTKTRVYFNPELVSAHFVVPGLVAVVLIMICALLTSIAITREKESGTMEQILTTPVRSAQVIIGKVIPYMGVAAVDTVFILLAGRLVFQVPMHGSWLILSGYTLLYLAIALGLGLLISAVTQTQQIAMMIALVGTLLPTIMLSGFIFPVASMPPVLRGISHIIPATYYLKVIRGVMLKGEAWFPFEGGVMLLMAMLILALAAKKFKARLA